MSGPAVPALRPGRARWPAAAGPRRLAGALLLASTLLAACSTWEAPRFDQPLRLGGVLVPAATLERGGRAYMRACRPCHGALGDGKGPQGVGMDPPPRDLRLGVVAFGSAPAGSLWRDEDLVRIVRGGLAGTGMRAWDDVSDEDLAAIVQFVKTLAPRFAEEAPEPAVEASPDPWTDAAAAAARGRVVYHALGRCQACHPAYASPAEIAAMAAATGQRVEPRPEPGRPRTVPSDFGRPLPSTDFARDPLRAVRPGHRAGDLYRAVAAGLGGTGMPTWKGALSEADLWATVHYLETLAPPGGR